jgi:hypothetical protein
LGAKIGRVGRFEATKRKSSNEHTQFAMEIADND